MPTSNLVVIDVSGLPPGSAEGGVFWNVYRDRKTAGALSTICLGRVGATHSTACANTFYCVRLLCLGPARLLEHNTAQPLWLGLCCRMVESDQSRGKPPCERAGAIRVGPPGQRGPAADQLDKPRREQAGKLLTPNKGLPMNIRCGRVISGKLTLVRDDERGGRRCRRIAPKCGGASLEGAEADGGSGDLRSSVIFGRQCPRKGCECSPEGDDRVTLAPG